MKDKNEVSPEMRELINDRQNKSKSAVAQEIPTDGVSPEMKELIEDRKRRHTKNG